MKHFGPFMKNSLKYQNTHHKANEILKRCTIPLWNNELKELWSNICTKENIIIKAIWKKIKTGI